MTSNFVWLVPATSDPAQRKGFHCYERTSAKDPVIRSHVSSIKRAAAIIKEIGEIDPKRPVIVDVGAYAGRELLRRVAPLLIFDESGFESRFFLTQQFPLVRDYGFAAHESVRYCLFSARSVGGKRPCCAFDPLIARIGVGNVKAQSQLSAVDARGMIIHPLCRVPLFFVDEAKRVHGAKTSYDAKLLERDILELAVGIASLCQSPFPVDTAAYVFTGNFATVAGKDSSGTPSVRSVMDDFIFAALSGPTKARKTLAQKAPVACEIIRRADKFLADIDVSATKIFESVINRNRYDRIRSFLDLIFGAWTVSFYKEAHESIPIVDLCLMQRPTRTRFVHLLKTLRAA